MRRIFVTVALCISLTAACGQSDQAATASGSSSAAGKDTSAAPAGDDAQGAGAEKAERAKAIADVKAMKPPLKGDARGVVCKAMRTLAEAADECDECLDAYVWGLKNDGSEDIADCSANDLPKVTKRADVLCAALADSMKESKYGTYEMGAIATQGDACKARFDDVIDASVKKMSEYKDGYKDISGAHLVYLERIFEYLTPDQKKKLQDAAKELEKKAREKKRDNLADDAKKLAEKK